MPTRTNLLTSGTTAANSPTFVVDAGAPAAIHIASASPDSNMAAVLERYDGTSYYTVGQIAFPGAVVQGIGTYRVRRNKVPVAFAVDVEK